MNRTIPRGAAIYGVDLGKNVFHVVSLDADSAVIQRAKFRRETLLTFFEQASRAIVGMEACSGSQWLARNLEAMGPRVRIVPAQFVKPYVKSQKNDTIDAEAVTRPTMRLTRVRTTDEVDLQALHRIRDQLISSRTRLINQVRGFCLEYDVAIRQGTGVFRRDLPSALADEENDLTPAMRRMLAELYDDFERLDTRIAAATREVEALAARGDRARQLMPTPGIGPLGATALLAAVGDGTQFRRARDLAAGARAATKPDRRSDNAARDYQARQPIRPPAARPQGAILRDAPRSVSRSVGELAGWALRADAREQGDGGAGGEDRTGGVGDHHQAGRDLRTAGSGRRLTRRPGGKRGSRK